MIRQRALIALLLSSVSGIALADDWFPVATVSTTIGLNANRLCAADNVGENIGCATTAPYLYNTGAISATGYISTSGNIYAANFYGDGSNLLNLPTQAVSVTTGTSGSLVFRDQHGTMFGSNTLVWSDGNVGLGTDTPLTPLHINQTGPNALRFNRTGHDDYSIYLGGNNGLY
ncbi:MAG: hypothetical protein WAX89_06845, partial [Alphaproteobacteria bacterium]